MVGGRGLHVIVEVVEGIIYLSIYLLAKQLSIYHLSVSQECALLFFILCLSLHCVSNLIV
jgi:hypothetical protein